MKTKWNLLFAALLLLMTASCGKTEPASDNVTPTLETRVAAENYISPSSGSSDLGGLHRGSGAKAGGLLIDLNGSRIPLHGQDLADEALGAYPHHVGHISVGQAGGNHQRAGNLHNFTAQIHIPSFL